MNKENLVNYFKKNKWTILSGVGFLIGGYFLLHTNFSYHLEDRTGKYILNPDYKEFHKYEWTDLKTVYPTKLAYDPTWFKLPPDKYIPKEQPIPREISNISDPIIRRQAYFNFLCKTEYAAYMTNDMKGKDLYNPPHEGILDLRLFKYIEKIKINNQDKYNNFSVASEANSNPFIFPFYSSGYETLYTNTVYDFFYCNKNIKKKYRYTEDSFKEIMDSNGRIYEIRFDKENSTFFPLKEVKVSSSRYYVLKKYKQNDSLKNLGIAGYEEIIVDRKENKLISYIQQFNLGAILPWKSEDSLSNFSWAKQSGCEFNPQYIDKF